jgi:hypothetical protein
MKKHFVIAAGVVLASAICAVVGINHYASNKISQALDAFNEKSTKTQIHGDVSANILTSSVSIDNMTLKDRDGVTITGSAKIEGINFLDKAKRLRDDVTISYKNLSSDETPQSKSYFVSGWLGVRNAGNGDLYFTTENNVVSKASPEKHFNASMAIELSDTQDIFDKANSYISAPASSKKDMFKEMGFGLYMKAMQSQLGSVKIALDNNAILQESIKEDLRLKNPAANTEEIESLYVAKMNSLKEKLSPEGQASFDNFIGKNEGKFYLKVEQKKGISLLEATFKSSGSRGASALKDYYTVTVE